MVTWSLAVVASKRRSPEPTIKDGQEAIRTESEPFNNFSINQTQIYETKKFSKSGL